jgi:CheY-like chemotaxis protein
MLVANNGREAVDMLQQQQVDLVLMDMQMPIMDGLTATQMLRQQGVRVPIIALTANALPKDCETYLQAGADDFLSKPIDRERLVRVLGKHLGAAYVPAAAVAPPEPIGTRNADDEAELFAEFKAKFISKLPEYLARLNELFGKRDITGLLFVAHDLKGMGASFGFPKISEISAVIESYAKCADLEQVSCNIDALNRYCANIA